MVTYYEFSICYLERSVYKTYTEIGKYNSSQNAYNRFQKLLKNYQVGRSSYYLCKWRELSSFEIDKISLDKPN